MICRHWRGWTTREQADAYQTLLTGTVLPEIFARGINGLIRYQAMARDMIGEDGSPETEHVVEIWFTSIDAIKAFAGDDYEAAHMPDAAVAVLKRWDASALHYRLLDMQDKGPAA